MKSFLLIVSFFLLLCSPASAFLEPPASLNKPFPGGTSILFFPKAEMWDRCSALAGKRTANYPAECGVVRMQKDGKMLPFGVSVRGAKRRCYVYINETFRNTVAGNVLFRHGRAHCHGWGGGHAGGVEVGIDLSYQAPAW